MSRLLTASLLAVLMLSCDPSPRPSSNDGVGTLAPTTEGKPEVECALETPRLLKQSLFELPVVTNANQSRLRLTFLDGTKATLSYPKELRSLEDSVSLNTNGGEPGEVGMRPWVSYRGVTYRINGDPIECPETRDGSLAGVWEHSDDRVLVLRYGNWYVSVFDEHTDIDVWATHLRGRVTGDGWLVLKGDERLEIGPERRYGDTGVMLGGLDPGVQLWPWRCRSREDTAADVAAGRGIESLRGKEAFASWCDREASMQVHVYARAEFIKRVASGLRIVDVDRAHPLSRYHILP